MKVALSVHEVDEPLLVRNLEWCLHLDGSVENSAVLVAPHGCDTVRVEELAEDYFRGGLAVVRYDRPKNGAWPQGKNAAFQDAARWVWDHWREDAWLWWEPDAIPLKGGWLNEIETEHVRGKAAVSGFIFGAGWVDGVAVYPGDFLSRSVSAMLCRAAPFDQVAGRDLLPHTASNRCFQVVWDVNGVAPSFKTRADAKSLLKQDAVLFHRCKDGSLIEVLGQGAVKRVFSAVADALVGGKKVKKKAPCVVMLGRYGDIINVLPVVKHLSETGPRPALMVAEKFADLGQGIGYADVHVWKGDFTDVQNALREAQAGYETVLVGQVNGRNWSVNTECDSFSAESWRQMGFLDKWNQLPLVFDRRNSKREAKLWSEVKRHPEKKTLLVNFAGKSSPFAAVDSVLSQVRQRWGNIFEVIDLGTVKATRLYDLLGLYDRADLLLTIDTATTHLALGSSIPVINLVVDTPTMWHGARPRGNSLLSVRYREVLPRMGEIHDVISRVATTPEGPRLVHVYSDYDEMGQDTRRRVEVARRTWTTQYRRGRWTNFPVRNDDLLRLFEDTGRKLPFVKDLLDLGCKQGDVVVLTNTDTCFSESATMRIADQLRHTQACYSFRVDFQRLTAPLRDEELRGGQKYPGSDLFVVKSDWWQRNRDKMPDMVLGSEAWDLILRILIDESHPGLVCRFDDVIYHERHQSTWEDPRNRATLPSQKHNIALAKQFLAMRGVDPKKHGIRI